MISILPSTFFSRVVHCSPLPSGGKLLICRLPTFTRSMKLYPTMLRWFNSVKYLSNSFFFNLLNLCSSYERFVISGWENLNIPPRIILLINLYRWSVKYFPLAEDVSETGWKLAPPNDGKYTRIIITSLCKWFFVYHTQKLVWWLTSLRGFCAIFQNILLPCCGKAVSMDRE